MGVPRSIMRALCAVIRPDHFKFASYGPAYLRHLQKSSNSRLLIFPSNYLSLMGGGGGGGWGGGSSGA